MLTNDMELKEIKDIFNYMDINQDGVLSKTELVNGLRKYGYNKITEVEQMFVDMDINQNNQIE